MKKKVIIKNGFRTMKPKNTAEGQLYDFISGKGWTVVRSGYPDFFCVKDNKIICVEVKPRATDPLKTNQLKVMQMLAAYGVPCYKWSPDGGFEKVKPIKEED